MRSYPGQLTQVLSAKLWTKSPTAQTGFSLIPVSGDNYT